MAANRVADMTIEELQNLIHDTVLNVLEELIVPENEDDLEFTDEIAASLREYLAERPDGEPAEKVMKELGLWDDE
jgi:hypothetical protein